MTERTNNPILCACATLALLLTCCGLAQAQMPNKKKIMHDATLAGDGTVALPLKITVPLDLKGSGNIPVVSAENAFGVGMYGSSPNTGIGVLGYSGSSVQSDAGVYGFALNARGVRGESNSATGVYGYSHSGSGVVGQSGSGYAGYFHGSVHVTGTLSKAGGSFKIDHPVDPANKYLSHSFVESPDMKNVYDGNITTNAKGEATVVLPEYFEALNSDFRYQLTAVGAPGPNLYVAEKITSNRFRIAGGEAGMEVSWQVTGIRQDAWAVKHRIPVEEEKPEIERGHFLHPDLFDQPEEKSVDWAREPELMKQMKEEREQRKAQEAQPPQ